VSWLSVARVSLAALAAAPPDTGLKWPNDIVHGPDSLKLAGVLAEVEGGAVVVGIGMNVGWAPPDLPATSLAALGVSSSRDEVLATLLESLTHWVAASDAEVARAYRERCVTIGRQVRVELPDETFEGTAADVADSGHLLVETSVCLREVSAGDVVHLR
jgi:BirA family transcriptional regulator, biotin operon repressor / biotin---[acetyl-CoA-carboxylase] ligase